MTERCTSTNKSCITGFRECGPCPFTEKDFKEGVIHELDPTIRDILEETETSGVLVGSLVSEFAAIGWVGNEPHQARAAVIAKLAR